MRRWTLIVAVLFSTASWAQNSERDRAALKAELQYWSRELDARGVEWRSKFKTLRSIQVGTTPYDKDGWSSQSTHTITVSPRALLSPYYFHQVIFHELGHYLFGLKHTSSGIMREKGYHERELEQNWNSFVDEYARQCKK